MEQFDTYHLSLHTLPNSVTTSPTAPNVGIHLTEEPLCEFWKIPFMRELLHGTEFLLKAAIRRASQKNSMKIE